MKLLKNQTKFFGISPVYLAMVQYSTQTYVKDLMERTNPELVIPFIDSLEEIQKVIDAYYRTSTPPNNLTAEDRALVYNQTVTQTFLFIYEKLLRVHLEEMQALVGRRIVTQSVSSDLMIDKMTLDQFIGLSMESKETFINDVVAKFDPTDYTIDRRTKVAELKDLISTVSIAVEMISRRIAVYETKTDKGFSPNSVFNQILNDVTSIDNDLFNELEFRNTMSEIGLDMTMCAKKFRTMEPAIRKMKSTKFNSNRSVSLMYCKNTIERLRTSLMSKLNEFESGVVLPRLYW